MEDSVNIVMLSLLAITALAIVRIQNLLAVVMLTGIYSLLTAGLFVVLDAVDVAFTEAAVGAGITTVLMLTTLALTGKQQMQPHHSRWLPLAVVLVTGGALLYATLDMPHFGDPTAPAHQHVAPRYIHTSPQEIGIPNMVTSVLASYRGFDTLGETTVVFTAAIGVLLLLGAGLPGRGPKCRQRPPAGDPVLRKVAEFTVPPILLFALYVQFHGEYGPGGGFQAGVIFAAAIILYALVFSLRRTERLVTPLVVHKFVALGLLLYAAVGMAAIFLGGNYLDYSVLAHDPIHGQHLGILLVELGVGITVAAVMVSIFYAFAGRRQHQAS